MERNRQMANTTPRICKDNDKKNCEQSEQCLVSCSVVVKAIVLQLSRCHRKQALIPNSCVIIMNYKLEILGKLFQSCSSCIMSGQFFTSSVRVSLKIVVTNFHTDDITFPTATLICMPHNRSIILRSSQGDSNVYTLDFLKIIFTFFLLCSLFTNLILP